MKKIIIDNKEYEVTDEYFDYLFCEQAKCKEIKVVDGKVVATEIEITTTQKAQNEILELKNWFETEYTYKEQKFRRLIALNKLDDDGIDAKTKLTELYIEAESKRTKIQMLENEV